MWPSRCSRHVRQHAEHQLDRAEVVELDRALVVVEAVVGEPRPSAGSSGPALLTSMSIEAWSEKTFSTSASIAS